MTSWCITYNVYYLPKQRRLESEDSEAFAQRIQQQIATQIGAETVKYGGQEMKKLQKLKKSTMFTWLINNYSVKESSIVNSN